MSAHAVSVILGTGKKHGPDSRSASEGYQRLVLLTIANIADNSGFCYHKIAKLAGGANVHRSTVNRHLDGLIALGELRMFKRGHTEDPVFVMTIVDHPLTTAEIVDRLTALDPRSEWRERHLDSDGDAIEEPVPSQGRLDLSKTLSQPATMSENHTVVSTDRAQQSADQGEQADRDRENRRNDPGSEIVADSDNVDGGVVAAGNDFVADGDDIVAVARRHINQRTKEPTPTSTTTTGLPRGADGGGGDSDPIEIARQWCDLRGIVFFGRVAEVYPRQVARFLEHHPPPTTEFLDRAIAEGIKHPAGWMFVTGAAGAKPDDMALPDCDRCDNRRWVAKASSGHLVKVDSAEDYDTVVRCPSCWPTGDVEQTG